MVELLHGWKDDPNTLAWLKTLPGFNELRNVDKETTAALAAPLEDDSGTINWLEELANSEELADTDLAATIRLFLKPLKQLKSSRYAVFVHRDNLAV
jgi:hypothetical protein